ncbi:MAG TPA: hypothetical protein PK981_06230 [Accumulibacter sp.]|nr:hypothetical protein [Accumulibacter sp.]HMX23236.1 hypothetical protein [Accumulibacter sp.]HNG38626.1 hypothetical protein [Accumulibacter sp.]HNL13857.1 hypothetical protein [Accumulibacter sp.]
MSGLLTPSLTLDVGRQQWTTQVLALELHLAAAPLLNVLSARLPADAPLSADPGDAVRLTLDNGEQRALVFSGTLEAICRSHRQIELRALDAGGVLARLRPAVTYEKIGAANLARNLCAAAGVAVGEVEDGEPLAFYAADPGRNALQHLARVYAWHGALAGVDAENRFFARQINAAVAESALRHGRETLAVRQCQGAENIEAIVFAGESAAPSASAATALRPVSDFFAGNRPDGPDLRHRWHFVPALRTATAAAKAGAAALRQQRAMLRRGVLEVFLQPALRPGAVFEVQDQPAGLERGPFWLTGVIHRLTPAGGRSRLHYAGGGAAFDPAALLGALLGSVF